MAPRHYLNKWWTIEPLQTNFSEILIKIQAFEENTFENVVCKMLSISSRP